MTKGESVELLVGLALAGAGVSYFIGWALVALALGGVLIAGAVLPALWRLRR